MLPQSKIVTAKIEMATKTIFEVFKNIMADLEFNYGAVVLQFCVCFYRFAVVITYVDI